MISSCYAKKGAIQNKGLSRLRTNVAQDRAKVVMVKQNLPSFLLLIVAFFDF